MRILLADDHALFRSGLAMVLAQLDAEATICEASRFDEALDYATQTLDLALLDLYMPGMDGEAGILRFMAAAPGVPVVVISGSEDADCIRDLLGAGAVGYIPKSSPSQVMLSALRLILNGGIYVPTQALHRATAAPISAGPKPQLPPPTERQLRVLRLLAEGKPNKVIAREMGISEGTVKIHLAALYRTLHVANRTEAVLVAQRQKLLPLSG